MTERLSLYGDSADDGGMYLHVRQRDAGWSVWLNADHDFDGLHIGTGQTRADAVLDAIDTLETAVRKLKEVEG